MIDNRSTNGYPASFCRTSSFVEDLIRINRLDTVGFQRFVFLPGMKFDRIETWWTGTDVRVSRHEGLDLCFFESKEGKRFRLDESTLIPAAFKGEIVHIMDDFLGQTAVVATPAENRSRNIFLTFYAHILLHANVNIGDHIGTEESFARIAPMKSAKAVLPPHLHLSFARPEQLPTLESLSWPVLNKVDRRAFIDPLSIIDFPFRETDVLSWSESCTDISCREAVNTEIDISRRR